MMCNRPLVAASGIAAMVALTAGCSGDRAQPGPSSPAPSIATSTAGMPPAHQDPPAQTVQPTKTVTVQPTSATTPHPPKPTRPGSEYDVPCTGGPDEGTICSNPNHGAGDDPYGTGTVAPTTTKPR